MGGILAIDASSLMRWPVILCATVTQRDLRENGMERGTGGWASTD